MKNSQVPNPKNKRPHSSNYGGESQNISKTAVQALIFDLEQMRLKKIMDNKDEPRIEFKTLASHYLSESQQLGALAVLFDAYEEEFAFVGIMTKNPMRRVSLAYAIEIAKVILPLNLEKMNTACIHDRMPHLEAAPAEFNVWPITFGHALVFLSGVLYENYAEIARRIHKLPSIKAAELAGALHIAHSVHRAHNKDARDLGSEKLMNEQLGRWATQQFTSTLTGRQPAGGDDAVPLHSSGRNAPVIKVGENLTRV